VALLLRSFDHERPLKRPHIATREMQDTPAFTVPGGAGQLMIVVQIRTLSTTECPGLQKTVRHYRTGKIDHERFREEEGQPHFTATGMPAEVQKK
jgi:hypothetical protein